MNKLFSAAAGASLLACVSALADNSSGMTPEQYCFPRFGGPFPDEGGVWPSVTMIYRGVTLTTTPFAAVECETLPSGGGATASMVTGSPPGPSGALSGGLPGASMSSNAQPVSDSLGGSSSALGSVDSGPGTQSVGSGVPALTPTGSPGNSAAGSSMAAGSNVSRSPTTAGVPVSGTPRPDAGMSSSTRVTLSGLVSSNSGTDDAFTRSNSPNDTPLPSGAPMSSSGLGGRPLATVSGNNGSPLASAASTSSDGLGDTPLSSHAPTSGTPVGNGRPTDGSGSGGFVSSRLSPNTTGSGSLPGPVDEQPQSTASTDASASTELPGIQISNSSNPTHQLSPEAVDALQLAQFLKNLGVSVFNTSVFTDKEDGTTPLLASVVANISTQEYKQHKALTDIHHRTGYAAIPPCQYTLPTNATDMALLMSTLKSIETGTFMSLSESLAADATQVAILLSSIASVAARQNAMLQACARLDTSMAAFETPLPATLAYSLAWNFVQPGSCKAELPMTILPTLSIGKKVIVHARPNDTVTFTWDDAARAAAKRSGRPLFIGWVNQIDVPAYTPLDSLGDGSGTTVVPSQLSGTAFAVLTTQPELIDIDQLTEATLAGPVVVSLV